MKLKEIIVLFILHFQCSVNAQTFLEADGPGDTYELINSIMAPGYNVIEAPDCNHTDFGRHIEEVFDAELNKHVFLFHIHTSPDNDRCQNFDRQRNEIKSYDKSPDDLKGVLKEEVVYRWKFKLDSFFQPSSSFTHLHQLKAVGGSEDAMPLITLTARKANPNRLELRYAAHLSQSTLYQSPLEPFLGKWLEVEEKVYYEEVGLGRYEILITDYDQGDTLYFYQNDAIRTWKTGASFVRPKWGIYRSLNDSTNLRDEKVLFADFYIEELDISSVAFDDLEDSESVTFFPNPAADDLTISTDILERYQFIHIYDHNGQVVSREKLRSNYFSTKHLANGLYIVQFSAEKVRTKPRKLIITK